MGTNQGFWASAAAAGEKIESERAQQHSKQDGQPNRALLDEGDDHDHGEPKNP